MEKGTKHDSNTQPDAALPAEAVEGASHNSNTQSDAAAPSRTEQEQHDRVFANAAKLAEVALDGNLPIHVASVRETAGADDARAEDATIDTATTNEGAAPEEHAYAQSGLIDSGIMPIFAR